MANYLVIGGSSGIGNELVSRLSEDGHEVWTSYHTNNVQFGESVRSFQYDVLKDNFPVEEIPDTLHGLAYCPGTINLKPFNRFTSEDFVDDFQLQVVGAVKVLQGCLNQLKKSEGGSVVLFSTVAVKSGFPFHSQVAASKGAIEGLTRSLAAEFAPKIRVNAIAPSITDTPLANKILANEKKRKKSAERNPMKRVGTPADIANAARFLLSDNTSWITGQIIGVDGGQSSID